MLSKQTVSNLIQLGITASQASDFANGVNLLNLVCQVYYNGNNPTLSSRIKFKDGQKSGERVLNYNIILNHLKKDKNIILPQQISSLTSFQLDDDQIMIKFVQFLISQSSNKLNNINNNDLSPPRQQENQLDNLYFAASLQKKNQFDDSLENQNIGDQVVRKGSFKILKPKLSSDSKLQSVESKQMQKNVQILTKADIVNAFYQAEPLKELHYIEEDNKTHSNFNQENIRKTIPKIYQRPPLYRSKQKQTPESEYLKERSDSLKDSKKQTPIMTASQTDRETIIKNIENITIQIQQEQKSLNLLNNSNQNIKIVPPKSKASRKIFTIDLPDVGQAKKKNLVQWLISINIISINAAKYTLDFHSICKDGVIFMEILNYYRGRGKNISYFKEPKRSAEMHSNFQKVFTLLQEVPEFKSQLIHKYEYFIPQAQPNAFWNLLASINSCFYRDNKQKNTIINRYQNSVAKTVENATLASKKRKINQSISYQDLKFNSTSVSKQKKQIKSNFSSIEAPRKQIPVPVNRLKSKQSDSKPPYGLIQNEEPVEENMRTQRGYKEMYLCKFKNIQTPSKNRSFTNNSLSRSRIRSSSAKKNQLKPIIPSISLEMQMGVLKYLKSFSSIEEHSQLFKDPYRNGILLCAIIKKQLGIDCFASKKPKNIEDCRNNFITAIEVIKNIRKNLKISYEFFVQDLVKGEKSLLFGLIWHIICEVENKKQPFSTIEINQNISQKFNEVEQQQISWIRSIEKHCEEIAAMKIRSQLSLHQAIINSDFLFHYACFITGKKAITPNFERPFNIIQKQSNLKKVLSYLIQNKIIRSDYLWKSKALLKQEGSVINDFINDLVAHFSRLYKKQQIKTVNFIKYIKRQDTDSKQKPEQKLSTTMANQTTIQNPPVIQTPQIQIGWMRKLGFKQNLELNNGVLLCRLVAKLSMKSINGVNQNPQSRAQCLGNIRRAIKQLPKFKWDQYDIAESDYARNLEVYAFLKDQFKHSYALKSIV